MPNRFFREDDIQNSTETRWRGKIAEELRKRNPFGDLTAAAIFNAPQVYLYVKEHFSPYGVKLTLEMDDEGLQVGFHVERGYAWAAETGWTLQPHWDWHHFMFLLGNSPGFLGLFEQARQVNPSFSFWVSSGDADPEELSMHASHFPYAAILGLLQAWPGHLWCNVHFFTHIPGTQLVKNDDEGVLKLIIEALTSVEPIYRALLKRKAEIDARSPAFSGSVQAE